MWDAIVATLKKHDPEGVPVPYLAPGFTDAKSWSRLGTRCYGFMPLRFPDDGVKFADLFHGHDERIPVEGLTLGRPTCSTTSCAASVVDDGGVRGLVEQRLELGELRRRRAERQHRVLIARR